MVRAMDRYVSIFLNLWDRQPKTVLHKQIVLPKTNVMMVPTNKRHTKHGVTQKIAVNSENSF